MVGVFDLCGTCRPATPFGRWVIRFRPARTPGGGTHAALDKLVRLRIEAVVSEVLHHEFEMSWVRLDTAKSQILYAPYFGGDGSRDQPGSPPRSQLHRGVLAPRARDTLEKSDPLDPLGMVSIGGYRNAGD